MVRTSHAHKSGANVVKMYMYQGRFKRQHTCMPFRRCTPRAPEDAYYAPPPLITRRRCLSPRPRPRGSAMSRGAGRVLPRSQSRSGNITPWKRSFAGRTLPSQSSGLSTMARAEPASETSASDATAAARAPAVRTPEHTPRGSRSPTSNAHPVKSTAHCNNTTTQLQHHAQDRTRPDVHS